jgi:putative transposase
MAAARRSLDRAINLHGRRKKITIDKIGSNIAAIKSVNIDACLNIGLRQSKYLNNTVEQDHRAVKRVTDPMMDFKSFWSQQKLIAGIETMHMVKKGQLRCPGGELMSAADQFYSLTF